jgi:hypothetical protein
MLSALSEVESQSNQSVFDLWCKARMANGQTIRCWPQYQGNQGIKHDWVLVRFEVDEDDEDVEPYPAKVLAMFKDIEGNFKVLVHLVAYKTTRKVEGPHGDSRLVFHDRLDFDQSSREPKVYSLPVEVLIKCIVAFESEQYQQPLVLQVRNGTQQKLHTVMTIQPKEEWARLFLNWTKEFQTRQETGSGRSRSHLHW